MFGLGELEHVYEGVVEGGGGGVHEVEDWSELGPSFFFVFSFAVVVMALMVFVVMLMMFTHLISIYQERLNDDISFTLLPEIKCI